MKNQYLLENSSEAIEMCEKLTNLLLSCEATNIALALQLMAGGGFPPSVIPYLWGLTFAENVAVDKKQLDKILSKTLQGETLALYKSLKTQFKKQVKEGNWLWHPVDQQWAAATLITFSTHDGTKSNLTDFATAFLLIAKTGGKHILQAELLPTDFVIKNLIQKNRLDLEGYDLSELPNCIGTFTELKELDFRGNRIKAIPDNFAQLKNIVAIYYDTTFDDYEMPKEAVEKLESFFPRLVAEKYKTTGWEHINNNVISSAIACFEKAVQLAPDMPMLWNDLSWAYSHGHEYEKAFQASDKAIELAHDITEKAGFLSNKASDLQRDNRLEECTKTAQETLDLLASVPQKSWDSANFFSYALASQVLGQFEESLQYYDLYEQHTYTYSDGSMYYNKACIYARLGNTADMVAMIKLCIERDEIDWVAEMRHDSDFKAYWDDPIIDELALLFAQNISF